MANLYAVQCCKCLCMVGISIKDFREEEIYCMKCAKELNKLKEKKE